MGKQITLAALVLMAFAASLWAHDPAQKKGKKKGRPSFPPDHSIVYKSIGKTRLKLNIYQPKNHKKSDKRAAIVFFFGGGWRGGSPKQFAPHARYLAGRGMVALAAEYRVYNRNKPKVADCVSDALSAVRWLRENANALGVDPRRIATGGGSAGGHLAAATGTLTGFDAKKEDKNISAMPNAMLLFNPALDLRAEAFNVKFKSKRYQEISRRLGAKAEDLSPTLHVKKGVAATIIFHGEADSTVPYSQAQAFTRAMKKLGNRCELAGYEGAAHGFFNFGRNKNKHFVLTLRRADKFLASLGFVHGKDSVAEFIKQSRR